MKLKCLHQHDFEVLRSLFSDTLASDRVTESIPLIHLHHFLYYCGPRPQFQRQIEPIQQSPQPTRSRQTSNLVLEELGSALNSVSVSSTSTKSGEGSLTFKTAVELSKE
ncbi:hypothetical protein TNCV_2773601 [Trichonephila clavipes]|nr:hypothetical protein TNCV_2773601 [Trichonephila clavipes]